MKKAFTNNPSTRDRGIGFTFGVSTGVISSWIIYGIYDSWAIFGGAKWWEVFTALGTVSAVTTALYFGLSETYEKSKKSEKQKEIYMKLFSIELSMAHSATGIIDDYFNEILKTNKNDEDKIIPISKSENVTSSLDFNLIHSHINELSIFDLPHIDAFSSIASHGPFLKGWILIIERDMKEITNKKDTIKKILETNKKIREKINFLFFDLYKKPIQLNA